MMGEVENCRVGMHSAVEVRKTGWNLKREVIGVCFVARALDVRVRRMGVDTAGR